MIVASMFPDLERLVQLQQLESAATEARGTVAAHPQRLADAEARLSEAKRLVDEARQRLKDSQDARRVLEKDVAVYQGRLTKFKDQLSSVKTNKEYTAIQHEIATAQTDLGVVEEKVLERMMEADAIAVEVKQSETALAAEQKVVDAEKKALNEELAQVEARLARATAGRDAVLKTLDRKLLSLFEQVAKVRKGVAIAEASRDGLCSGCRVRLRPQVFQVVRTNDQIVQCDSCQRILYYVPPPPPVEPPVVRTGPA
jgi:predicted  nucleic acid-binding Zn-ribbon protein